MLWGLREGLGSSHRSLPLTPELMAMHPWLAQLLDVIMGAFRASLRVRITSLGFRV